MIKDKIIYKENVYNSVYTVELLPFESVSLYSSPNAEWFVEEIIVQKKCVYT